MKKIVSLLLVVILAAGLFASAIPAMAAETVASGTCGENLTWTLDEDGTLTISGTGEMEGYSSGLPTPWNDQKDAITSVVIVNGVTSIGTYAFRGYTSLTSVTIPDSVTNIGWNAFYGCTGLADEDGFIIVKGILFTYIGDAAKVVIPDGVTKIDNGAFYGCTGLTSVTIPDGVAVIGHYAFYDCTSLTRITIGSKDVQIAWEAGFGYYSEIVGNVVTERMVEGATIYGLADSTAQAYAEEYRIPFVVIEGFEVVNGQAWHTYPVDPETSATTYVLGSDGSIVIHASGALEDFVRLLVDGKEVAPSNYKLTEGSTIVTISGTFLNTLSAGEHTVTLEFKGGVAKTAIQIVKSSEPKPSPDNPKTGDNAALLLWTVLLLTSAMGVVTVSFRRKQYE